MELMYIINKKIYFSVCKIKFSKLKITVTTSNGQYNPRV